MSLAYCTVCQKEVVAVSRPQKILGGYTLNTPGRIHPVMLVHAPEESYCPECGHTVVTERQIKTLNSYSTQSEVLFWGSAGVLLVWTIGGLIVAASTGGRFNIGIGFLLLFAVPGAYVALLIYGERRLPATALVVLTVLLIIGFSMESREDIELRQQDQQRRVDEARERSEQDAREAQAQREATLREEQLATEAAKRDENEKEARRAAVARQEERSRREAERTKATAEALKHRGNIVFNTVPFTINFSDGSVSFKKGTAFRVIYHNPDGSTCVETRDDVWYHFQTEYGSGTGLVQGAVPDGLTVSDSYFTADAGWLDDVSVDH